MKFLSFFILFFQSILSAQADSTFIITDSLKINEDSSSNNYASNFLEDSIKVIENDFTEFEYTEVIRKANSLILHRENLNNRQLINLFKMKGISHYSLAEDIAAQNSFMEILRIDSSFNFDSTKTSPKIVTFFNNVKDLYRQQLIEQEKNTLVKIDTVFISKPVYNYEDEKRIKQSIFRSLLLPGLGHLYLGYNTKGWILSVLSVSSLSTMIYFISDTERKEKKYLGSNNSADLNSLYQSYNDSYKIRNFSIMAFAAIWLYSQIDLLIFSDINESEEISFQINSTSNINSNFSLTINFPF